MDGVLGLALGTFDDDLRMLYIDSLYDENVITKRVYTIFLSDDSVETHFE